MLKDKYKIILIKENQFQLKEFSISFIKLFIASMSFIFFGEIFNINDYILNCNDFKRTLFPIILFVKFRSN